MKYWLVIGRTDNKEIVFDKWYSSIAKVYDTFDELVNNISVGYYITIAFENNGSLDCLRYKEGVGND